MVAAYLGTAETPLGPPHPGRSGADVLVSGGPPAWQSLRAGGRKQKKTRKQGPAGGPGSRELGFALSLGFQRCLDLRHLRGWSSSVGSLGPSRLSTHFCFKIGYHAFCFLPQGGLGPQEAGSGHYTHVFLFSVWGARALKASERGPTYQYINPGPPSVNEKKQGKHGAENKEDVHVACETVDVDRLPCTCPWIRAI